MIILSETSPPLCSTSAVSFPNGVSRSLSRRRIAPGEVTGMPNWRVIISAWVPFPEPGAPRRTSRLFTTVLSPVQEDSDAGNKQHGDPNIEPQQRAACCRFAATVRPARKCSPPNAALAQETVVMPLNKVRLDLAHGIEHDAHYDQQACATKKLRRDHGHIQSLAQKTWQHRY